ncbi:unnamed protein product [Meloidogyne enterolobii]|uniref:Uncharacterized protein n=1 Tax=Meloidogyne enterolobii TaxID=390850 RepID=A0ACB0ZXX6_MELEN
MSRKKSFLTLLLFYLTNCLIQTAFSGRSLSGSGRKSFISRHSSEGSARKSFKSLPSFKTEEMVAEEYVQKLVGKTQYFMPKVIDGDVYCKEGDFVEIKGDENLEKSKKKGCKYITSKDITVAKLFEYFYLKIDKIEGMREKLEQVEFENDKCNIGFPLPKNIFGKAFLLDTALTFSGDELKELVHGEEKMVYNKLLKEEEENDDEEDGENNDEEEEEGDARLSTHILLEPIYKGSSAFTENFILNFEKIPKMEYEYEIQKQKNLKDTSKRISEKIHTILKNMIERMEKKIGKENDKVNQTSSQKANSLPREEPPSEENEDAPINMQSVGHDNIEEDISALKELKDDKLTIDKKLKLEIYQKKEEIERKLIGILNGYKTVEEKKGQIGRWKVIVDDWEKDARKSFEKKIEIKKDEEGHKKLLEYKPHVFEFLKEVTFGVSIKPSNKRFKKLEEEEYEELIEFFKNPREFLNSPPEENETANNDQSENSENKWKKKLSEKLLKFIFEEMEEIKGKGVGEGGRGDKEEQYIIKVLNEEFKWLNLGFKRKIKETVQKKVKVENNRMFVVEDFIKLKKELTDIDNGIENCKMLKDPILQVLRFNDESDTIHQEFRGRSVFFNFNGHVNFLGHYHKYTYVISKIFKIISKIYTDKITDGPKPTDRLSLIQKFRDPTPGFEKYSMSIWLPQGYKI